ncbi:expressed unknown protein [Seminavis robusta]|uniref:Uncharacterized protein n=1 Tax=Seminavis robusta TaxID=568900 RepID=A0A9N8ECY9_9STRA|nr:expressed unknown protein [Seminavis robusta]|eukprot:Sro993_g228940.1 n/a (562) ;mRNA; f:25629-27314
MPLPTSTKRYLEMASATSMQPTPSPGQGYCETERDYWRVFFRVCDLGPNEIKTIHALDYTSITRLSLIGMHKNTESLLKAGISEVKAHMIQFFCTYLLHCKYHQYNVSKDLKMDQILEFNFLLANPEQAPQGEALVLPVQEEEPAVVKPKTLVEQSTKGDEINVLGLDASDHTKSSKISSKSSSSKTSSKSSKKNHRRRTSATSNGASGTGRKKSSTRRRFSKQSSMDASEGSVGSMRSFASKSSLRSCRSSASKKSVSWNPTFKFNQSFGSSCPAIDERSTRTPTTMASTGTSRWSACSTIAEHSQRELTTADSVVESSPPARRTSSSSDEKARRPRRRPSVDVALLEMDALQKLYEQKEESSKSTLPLFPPVHAEENSNSGSLKETKNTLAVESPKPTETVPCGVTPCNMMLEFTPHAVPPPPSCPYKRSSLRWAQALDVEEDLTDDDWSDSDDDSSDWDSSDDDASLSGAPVAEAKAEAKAEALSAREPPSKKTVFSWKSENVTIGEWTLPANRVLPVNLQSIFRAASENPDLNIEEQIHQALSRSTMRTGMVGPTAA